MPVCANRSIPRRITAKLIMVSRTGGAQSCVKDAPVLAKESSIKIPAFLISLTVVLLRVLRKSRALEPGKVVYKVQIKRTYKVSSSDFYDVKETPFDLLQILKEPIKYSYIPYQLRVLLNNSPKTFLMTHLN